MIDHATIERRFVDTPIVQANIREVTIGNRHAEPGDPAKVADMHRWLLDNPQAELPPLLVFPKPNGTLRIYDGRHRFVAYVLAERETSRYGSAGRASSRELVRDEQAGHPGRPKQSRTTSAVTPSAQLAGDDGWSS